MRIGSRYKSSIIDSDVDTNLSKLGLNESKLVRMDVTQG